jgi:hypothetical protein
MFAQTGKTHREEKDHFVAYGVIDLVRQNRVHQDDKLSSQ